MKGREIAEVIIPPHLRDQHYRGFSRFLETGEARIMDTRVEVAAMRSGGAEFPVELTVTAFHARGKRFFTAFIRDISTRVEMEERLRCESRLIKLLHRLTSLANEVSDTRRAIQGFLEAVCSYTGWPVGHAYLVAPDMPCRELYSSGCWYLEDEHRYAAFRAVSEERTFCSGEGVPGMVHASGEPIWIEDIHQEPNFPRDSVNAQLELTSGFALPVFVGREVMAVLEFYTPERFTADADLLATLNHVGIELGRVIERDRNEQQLQYLADHDTLTGLPNLRVGRDRLQQAVATAKRQKQTFALLYVDLDGFK